MEPNQTHSEPNQSFFKRNQNFKKLVHTSLLLSMLYILQSTG